ncbi:MAG TPA: DUF6599 family protein [Candidatus Krumholzibacterium sp.]|nr:DUF6599 family protein [Candidatus Krumholzibacterium sp.]
MDTTKRFLQAVALVLFLVQVSHSAPAVAGTADLLPGPGVVEGWDPDDDLLTYGPDDLWEYINGSAETFLMYDFKEVVAMHYQDEAENEVKVEIYRHGSPLMTFGIYSQFRSPDAGYLDIGAEAFGDEYAIHFWKGDYYVKIDSYSEEDGMGQVMKAFAEAVEGAITEEGKEPMEVSLFPDAGLQKKSIVFLTEGVMGSGQLPPAFVAPYLVDEEKGKVYLFSPGDEAGAKALIAQYAGTLGVSVEEKELGGTPCLTAAGEAPYRGRVVAVQKGRWMAVVTGFGEETGSADSLAAEIAAKLAAACGV